VAAIKRAVYFGGSMSLTNGLHVESTEFLHLGPVQRGPKLMLDYMETTDATGELPLYNPDTYKQALEPVSVRGIGAKNGPRSQA
jgi:enoyl-CoA hydratase